MPFLRVGVRDPIWTLSASSLRRCLPRASMKIRCTERGSKPMPDDRILSFSTVPNSSRRCGRCPWWISAKNMALPELPSGVCAVPLRYLSSQGGHWTRAALPSSQVHQYRAQHDAEFAGFLGMTGHRIMCCRAADCYHRSVILEDFSSLVRRNCRPKSQSIAGGRARLRVCVRGEGPGQRALQYPTPASNGKRSS